MSDRRITILGGGFQGCCVALMLSNLGFRPTLIEKKQKLMSSTSLNQEGKVHLGFVYGLDKTFETASRLVNDSLVFSEYLDGLVDYSIDWTALKSTTFEYLIRRDSLLSVNQVEEHFKNVNDAFYANEVSKRPEYIGSSIEKLFSKKDIPSYFNDKLFKGCFETAELALSPERLAEVMRQSIESKEIELVNNCEVTSISPSNKSITVMTDRQGEYLEFNSDLVINCLWNDQLHIENFILPTNRKLNYRFKLGLVAEWPNSENTQSFTIIQGPYGDFVNYPREGKIYFSWYPLCKLGMCYDNRPPKEWSDINGLISESAQSELIELNLQKLKEIIDLPISEFQNCVLKGGIIVGDGDADINLHSSLLHSRSTNPIFKIGSNYIAIRTGKFSSAPRNTWLLEQQLIDSWL